MHSEVCIIYYSYHSNVEFNNNTNMINRKKSLNQDIFLSFSQPSNSPLSPFRTFHIDRFLYPSYTSCSEILTLRLPLSGNVSLFWSLKGVCFSFWETKPSSWGVQSVTLYGTPYNGLYWEAPPKRDTLFRKGTDFSSLSI